MASNSITNLISALGNLSSNQQQHHAAFSFQVAASRDFPHLSRAAARGLDPLISWNLGLAGRLGTRGQVPVGSLTTVRPKKAELQKKIRLYKKMKK
jgi:hypothetical protein